MTLKLIKVGAVIFGLFCVQGAIYAADEARLVGEGEFIRLMQAHREQTRQMQDEMLRGVREGFNQMREAFINCEHAISHYIDSNIEMRTQSIHEGIRSIHEGMQGIHAHFRDLGIRLREATEENSTRLSRLEEKIERVRIENQERRLDRIQTEMRIMELMIRQEQRIRELTEALRDRAALLLPVPADAESTSSEEATG